MSTGECSATNDLDGFRPVIPANRYYLNHMLKHVERCIDAVDQWLVDRKSKRSEVMAQLASEVMPQLASEERASIPVFDLPELWLPASVDAYLPEPTPELTLSAIHSDVAEMRSKCETIESPQELHEFILEAERKVATLVRVYVRPYEQLRLEIWTRLQQLDQQGIAGTSAARQAENGMAVGLIDLANSLTIEQMVEQWFSQDPESSIEAFMVRGRLRLTVNLVYRTVTRDGFSDMRANFGSKQAAWLPFIIAFFAGRNGVDPSVAENLYDQASSNLNPDSKKRASARRKAIASTNVMLLPLDVCVTTKWGLKSVGQP